MSQSFPLNKSGTDVLYNFYTDAQAYIMNIYIKLPERGFKRQNTENIRHMNNRGEEKEDKTKRDNR